MSLQLQGAVFATFHNMRDTLQAKLNKGLEASIFVWDTEEKGRETSN
jgi:hypothetical protein